VIEICVAASCRRVRLIAVEAVERRSRSLRGTRGIDGEERLDMIEFDLDLIDSVIKFCRESGGWSTLRRIDISKQIEDLLDFSLFRPVTLITVQPIIPLQAFLIVPLLRLSPLAISWLVSLPAKGIGEASFSTRRSHHLTLQLEHSAIRIVARLHMVSRTYSLEDSCHSSR